MPKRWTIKELNNISDVDFAIEIMHERKSNLTNYYSPLNKRILKAINGLKAKRTSIEKTIKYLEKEKENFKEQGYCTSYDMALDQVGKNLENGADCMYDVGRYEMLCDILHQLTENKENEQ